MKRVTRLLCLLAVLCLASAGAAWAEPTPADSLAIVRYDHAALPDWAPGYGLSIPGLLLELTHPEAFLTVSAIQQSDLSPARHLSGLLDRAGETLSVSDAQTSTWEGQSGTDEYLLSYSYTYPDGDEPHQVRIWAAVFGDMLIDLTVDAWGEDAQLLIDAAMATFVEDGFTLTVTQNAVEFTGSLSDVIEDETGLVSIQLTAPDAPFRPDAPFYRLAENAVILFPRPDDPLLLFPVLPDYASIADAILLYEESSDSPAVFRTIIEDNQIIYMEYGLMQ